MDAERGAAKTLGTWLRNRRIARGATIAAIAERAQVHERSVGRWERDECLPRVPELKSLLKALEISQADQQQAWTLLKVPRAVIEQSRGREPSVLAATWRLGEGDLWKALRHRQGYSLAQAAVRTGYSRGIISRWEHTLRAPSPEARAALYQAFGVASEAQQVLESSIILPGASLQDVLPTLAACEEHLDALMAATTRGMVLFADLHFLALEAHLKRWTTGGHTAALRLLALAWTAHADYLHWRGRLREMRPYIRQASLVVKRCLSPEPFWLTLPYLFAFSQVHGYGKEDYAQGVTILKPWMPFAERFVDTIGIKKGIADYAAMSAQFSLAHQMLDEAHQEALQRENDWALRAIEVVRARTYLEERQPQAALACLENTVDNVMHQRAHEAFLRAQAFEQLGAMHQLDATIRDLFSFLDRQEFPHLWAYTEWLARGL